jgi:hypothetical protein
MTATEILHRKARPIRHDVAEHLFTIGQAVRLKGGLGRPPSIAIYQIAGTLPPIGGSPQYRIRNEDERHDRVTTQDSIEPVEISPDDDRVSLLERTFGRG